MQRDTDFLIRRIYDAVDNVDALPDVLSGLCERIGGENAMLGVLMKAPGGSLMLSAPSRRLPLSALVTPLVGTLAVSVAAQGPPGAAAVFLSDPERHAVTLTEHLRTLYKLSPTEARVAWLIARSESISDAAKSLGLAPGTVRTHLKHIYAKTGVNRQSALAYLLGAASVTRVP